jgi:hypothetical protein
MKSKTEFLIRYWFMMIGLISIFIFEFFMHDYLPFKFIMMVFTALFFTIVGGTCNIIAVWKNDWKMPVFSSQKTNGRVHKHYKDYREVKYMCLTDVNRFILPPKFIMYFSLGDVFILIGALFWIVTFFIFYL